MMARLFTWFICASAALLARLAIAQVGDVAAACSEIQSQMSSSGKVMTNILSPDFNSATYHWFFISSSQIPTCVVEVGSQQDVAAVMQTISQHRVPWAIKSGGHSSNPGFSSTTGVHISIANLNQVTLSPDNSTVEIGFGQTWSDVYEKLDGSGVNVVGGRTAGPGVGGFTLGGGYSWKTNQFGLTSDTVKLYNIVLTNGTITTASADTNPDLFWALQGGLNKFGVVTSAEFNTHTQPDQIYGGIIIYSTDYNDQIIAATQKFSEVNTDPKAQLITTLNTTPLGSLTFVIYFYDGPDPGNVFSMFDGIESTINLVSTQTFSSFVSLVDSNIQTSPRGSFNTMPTTKLSAGFLAAVANQSQALSNVASNYSGILLSYDVEPFLNYGQYARSSAFPHADSAVPLNLYYSWIGEDNDEFWLSTMQSNVDQLKQVAISEGIFNETAPLYPNYSPSTATLDQLYSSAGAARLREIRSAYDPGLVGDLAGGFSFK